MTAFSKSTQIRFKMVKYPYVTESYCPGATISLLLDVNSESDQEMADVLKLRDHLTDILEDVFPGSQMPLPNEEVVLNESYKRYHRVYKLAHPCEGDEGFTSV